MILLLGGTGNVGRSTLASLEGKKARFRVGLRSPDRARDLKVESVAFDWSVPETYGPALRGVETVFLLTPVSEQQVGWGHSLLAEAKAAGVRRVVKLSAAGAEREPGIAISRMHRLVERAIEGSGLAWTFLRPNFFMQNFTSYYGVDPAKGGTVYLPHGTGKVSWVDARDVGELAARVLTEEGQHDGNAYTLTGPQSLDTAEACALLAGAVGKPIDYVDVPESAAQKAMEGQGMPLPMVSALLELHATIRNNWAAGGSPSEMGRLLGREPRTFAQFAADLAAGTARV
jgi:uncharacterized protein YbjT (DUF2867 family)